MKYTFFLLTLSAVFFLGLPSAKAAVGQTCFISSTTQLNCVSSTFLSTPNTWSNPSVSPYANVSMPYASYLNYANQLGQTANYGIDPSLMFGNSMASPAFANSLGLSPFQSYPNFPGQSMGWNNWRYPNYPNYPSYTCMCRPIYPISIMNPLPMSPLTQFGQPFQNPYQPIIWPGL